MFSDRLITRRGEEGKAKQGAAKKMSLEGHPYVRTHSCSGLSVFIFPPRKLQNEAGIFEHELYAVYCTLGFETLAGEVVSVK